MTYKQLTVETCFFENFINSTEAPLNDRIKINLITGDYKKLVVEALVNRQ